MPAKPNSRNWNDVQTAIATVAIASTLGLWNLFAIPAKAEAVQDSEPDVPPTEEPLAESSAPVVNVLPQVKIMFTQTAPQTTTVVQQTQPKKKKNKDKNKGGSVTQTKTS